MNGKTLGDKTRFKIGDGIKRVFRPLDVFETLGSGDYFFHPLEVGKVVCFEAKFATGNQGQADLFDKFILYQTTGLVSAFWPRIRE